MKFRNVALLMPICCSLVVVADSSKFTSNTMMDLLYAKENVMKVKSISSQKKTMSAFIRYKDDSCIDSLKSLGVEIRTKTKSILTANIPLDKLDAVSDLSGVITIQAGQPVDYCMDVARPASGVDKVQAGEAPLKGPFLGEGTIVGVVDGGVDFTHPAFRTEDRSELRIKRVWNQTATQGTPPEGYSIGAEYKTPEDILAAESDLKYWSHGSHVMNIAAGADIQDGNKYYGIARKADLAFSNFASESAGIIDALNYIFKYADSEGKPAVINMSLGTQMGPHDGTSLLDVAAGDMVKEGHIIVGAMGNDGTVEVHIQKDLTAEANKLNIGMAFKADTQGYAPIDIWGQKDKAMKINVVTIDKSTNKTVYKSRTFDASKTYNSKITLQLPYDKSSGYFNIITGISPLNGKPNARIDLAIGDFYPDKFIAIIVTGEDGETIHAWTNSTYAIFRQQSADMDIPDLYTSPSEIGGVADAIISVGSYGTKQNVTLEDGTVSQTVFPVDEISAFSNRGPSVDGRMKPDVVAPGCQIVSALNGFGGNSDGLVATHKWNGKDYYYGTMLGTSMASPHVAGIISTWLGACPTLTVTDIRAILDKTCKRDKYTGSEPNNVYGYGKIDAYNGLLEVLKSYASVDDVKANVEDNTIVNVADGVLRVAFLKEIPNVDINVYNISGALIDSRNIRNTTLGEEYTLDFNDNQKGVYVVKIAAGKEIKTYKFFNN